MKNLKIKLVSIIAACTLFLGLGFAPVVASAEEVTETPEISTEIPENPIEDETVEEIPEVGETEENTPVIDENEEISSELGEALEGVFGEDMTKEEKLEVILDIVGAFAENAGVGDKWDEAIFNMKTAASEQKVNANIIVDIISLVALIAYIIGKLAYRAYKNNRAKKSPDTVKKDVSEIKSTSVAQNKAINNVGTTVTEINDTVKHEDEKLNTIAEAGMAQNAAIRAFIRGTQLKSEVKDEAYRDLNKSDELYENAKK